jgi:Trehalase
VLNKVNDADLRTTARSVLERHWDAARGFSVPNAAVYPHQWLWDSCFHVIIWAALDDDRATQELAAVFTGQLPGGLVPHMRYGGVPPDTFLGPLPATSSLAQPPMFGHAIRVLASRGIEMPAEVIEGARRGLDWLWLHRRTDQDLVYVVHPWEAGNDHSPRWDGWGAPGRTRADWDRAARTAWNKQRMHDVTFDDVDGAAAWSSTFVVCPAGFNAYVAYNFFELAAALDDGELAERARRVASAMDRHLWDPAEGLWADLPIVGGGASLVTTPISDGAMGALVTADAERAAAALTQLQRSGRFAAPFGPANVARSHPAYDPGMYWRGAAWPPLTYLFWRALRRWERFDAAAALAKRAQEAAVSSRWAEYWDPETGSGLGAMPQSWTGLAIAMDPGDAAM